ncbi:MAG: cation:proton antiporter [Candidatus Dadabacteria bacterium]|nr:cation:proton antiporter [Candidatus Dadabacteria bacterium]
MVSLALVLGVIGQMLSIRTGFPSIVFFLIFGILVGPEFLSLVHPSEFGEGLEVIIKLCVAIVLFEAGLNLNKEDALSHGSIIVLLITVGALITMIGGAFFAYFLGDLSWEMAFVYGSLVIVTGPTVVQPLLRRFKVKPNLKHILEYEGVLIDPVGALIALFVVEVILIGSHSASGTIIGFAGQFMEVGQAVLLVAYKFLVGGLLGVLGGYAATFAVKRFYIYMEDFVDLFILASALAVYGFAEMVTLDSGLVAAIVSGAIVGNLNIPEEEEMKKFKGKLTILVISLLFIFLAASLELDYIRDLGIYGPLIVLGLLFIVRPVEIFLLCIRSGLSIREKIFLSFVSPRGIIAASIASIIALELHQHEIEGANTVQGLVFLTIAISVFLQGGVGGFVSRVLGVNDKRNNVVIVGANNLARLLARLLEKTGKRVCLIDTNRRLVELSGSQGLNAVEGNALTVDGLEKTEISSQDTLISLTTSDHVNVLACRLVRIDFKVAGVCALLNHQASSSDIEDMQRFRVPLAFGKQIDIMDIYSKIAGKEYVVFRSIIRKEEIDNMNFEKSLPEHLIPLVVERARTDEVFVYHEGFNIEAGDKVSILDVNPVLTSPDIIEGTEKDLIEV